MQFDSSIRRYRQSYARLLQLFPKSYHNRFGEGMEQTFGDLLRERAQAHKGLFSYALWMFLETSAGIIRENITFILMQNKRLLGILLTIVCLLAIPLVAMQFTDDVDWDLRDFVIMGSLMLITGLTLELIARKVKDTTHRVVLGLVAVGVFLIIWADLAVGVFNIPGISGS